MTNYSRVFELPRPYRLSGKVEASYRKVMQLGILRAHYRKLRTAAGMSEYNARQAALSEHLAFTSQIWNAHYRLDITFMSNSKDGDRSQ